VNVAAKAIAKVAPNRASFFFILFSSELTVPKKELRPALLGTFSGEQMVEL
jgi:hypothetical protein